MADSESSVTHGARSPLGAGRLVAADLGAFALEAGGPPLPLTLAYRHDGPGPDAPQVLVIHALTGSADAAGDWWAPLIGPGRRLRHRPGRRPVREPARGQLRVDRADVERPGDRRALGRVVPRRSRRATRRAPCGRSPTGWASSGAPLVTGGSLGGMIALEVALERPDAVDHVVPIAAPAATGALAIAWNHIQLELVDRLGDEGLALARQLAMTTYRSEADFDGRFGRDREPDGRFAISSYLDHQGDKLVERFDPDTYRMLVRVMDGHDVGRGRGGIVEAFRRLADAGTGLTGLGIEGDILYGPAQVRALWSRPPRGRRGRDVPRARVDQGPRRVPDRVGPADADPRRCAGGRRPARNALSGPGDEPR